MVGLGRGRRVWWAVAALIGGVAGLWAWEARRATGLVPRGLSAYARGDWDRSADLARRRWKEAPGDQEALRLLARALARRDRDQAALAAYSRLEPRWIAAEDDFLLGRALGRTGRNGLALNALEAARAAEPDRFEALDELARAYFRDGRPAAAEAIAERLVRQPGWEARGQWILGTCRAARLDPAGAARALARAVAIDPDGHAAAPQPVGPLRMLLARSLLQTGRPTEARKILEAVPAARADSESSWLLSRCFLQERAWDEAAAALARAGTYRQEWPVDPEPAPFVGEAVCASCHPSTARKVLASHHAATFTRPVEPSALSFPDRPIPDPADPRVSHSFRASGEGTRVEARVGDQVFGAVARYAFGSPDHYVTLVGPDDRGVSRMLRISSYHSPKGSGLDVTNGLPPRPADPVDFLGAAMPAGDGERRCLTCHTTNPHSIEVRSGPESTDHAIGCEACHGPGGNHVLAREGDFDDPAIVAPRHANAKTINGVCERCHGGAHLGIVDGPVDDPAWLRFQSTTMYRSRCYTESRRELHCATCHDPHADAETAPAFYEAKCLNCHGPGQTVCPVNAANGCIACHMPRTWMASTHAFKSDHYIRAHPRRGTPPG